MKFSEQWLRSLIDPGCNSAELAEKLTMAGLEVEENQPVVPEFSGVVVAEVLAVRPHENAERLRVCSVNIGQGEALQIVCGASNVAAGLKVPCAVVGARLPGGLEIRQATLRGVESFGMLCAARELGLDDTRDGLWCLPVDAPVGLSIREYAALDDRLLTLKLTPNRADCLSLHGIAREVGALTGQRWQPPAVPVVVTGCDDTRKVRVVAPEACPRYLGRVIRQVNAAAATPDWMLQNLARSGVRAVSAIVDITNYILLELGQPLHAFDHGQLQGDVVVRFANVGESIALLNGKTVSLEPDMLVIADDTGPRALAGIMGGQQGSVSPEATQDIFLEAAFFSPVVIAGRSRRIGLGSDSSHRFERGVDYAATHTAMARATALILEICGGQAGPVTEALANLPQRKPVSLRLDRLARVLGMRLEPETVASLLTSLGLAVENRADTLVVTPPSYRFDIEIEEDLIEEVARLYGYDRIVADAPRAPQHMLPQPGGLRPVSRLKEVLVGREYQEIVSYAFVDSRWEADFAANPNPIRLQNPIAAQMSVMRSTLIGGLVDNLINNLNRKHERVRLFELARVFQRSNPVTPFDTASFLQPEKLSGLAYGPRNAEQWGSPAVAVDFYDVKADVEALLLPRQARFIPATHPALHPGRTAQVLLDGQVVGVLGELHPQWVQTCGLSSAPILFELDLAPLTQCPLNRARPVSRFQPVRRDLAFIVAESVSFQAACDALESVQTPLTSQIAGFDVYRGKGIPEGKKSLAFKVILQDTQRTLTDGEVETALLPLIQVMQDRFNATLRQ